MKSNIYSGVFFSIYFHNSDPRTLSWLFKNCGVLSISSGKISLVDEEQGLFKKGIEWKVTESTKHSKVILWNFGSVCVSLLGLDVKYISYC